MTLSKELLSGSAGGQPIKVVATATPGTTIHATGSSATTKDLITLYAHNTSTSPVVLTVEFGETTSPDNTIIQSIPAKSGLTLVIPALPLIGDGTAGRVVRAFAGTADVVTVVGEVDRIVP